eukprot:4367831-Pleurochrysis_carterae.AAC.1
MAQQQFRRERFWYRLGKSYHCLTALWGHFVTPVFDVALLNCEVTTSIRIASRSSYIYSGSKWP